MALNGTLMSNEYKKVYTGTGAKIPAAIETGKFRYKKVVYETPAGETVTSGAIIKMMKVPRGAQIVDVYVTSDDLGTTGAGNLGWLDSQDKNMDGTLSETANASGFFSALDFATAPLFRQKLVAASPALFKTFNGEVDMVLTMTASTTTVGKITVELIYTVE